MEATDAVAAEASIGLMAGPFVMEIVEVHYGSTIKMTTFQSKWVSIVSGHGELALLDLMNLVPSWTSPFQSTLK